MKRALAPVRFGLCLWPAWEPGPQFSNLKNVGNKTYIEGQLLEVNTKLP